MTNLQKGLVGHWTMDDADTSDGTLYDSSAYDNHGTLVNNPTTGVSGQVGEAYDFDDANNEHCTVPNLKAFNDSTFNFTVSAWFKTIGAGQVFHPRGQYDIDFQVGNQVSLGWYDGSPSTVSGTTTVDDGNWHHAVWQADTTSGEQFVYVDGELEASDTQTFDPNNLSKINTISRKVNQYFDASIDDLRVYNRVLSANEVRALYNMRSQRQITSSPRVNYYNTQELYNANSHPSNLSEMDNFTDQSRGDVSLIYGGIHERDTIYHGAEGQSSTFGKVNSTPNYFTRFAGYSWEVKGKFVAEETGTYSFGIDGDDAMDLFIDGTNVTSWYGGHGFDGDVANHSGTISLTNGNTYDFRFRYEEGGGGSGAAVGWQRPSDSSWKIFPANKLVR